MGKLGKNQFYCVKCRDKVTLDTAKIKFGQDKNGRDRIHGKCKVCNTKVFRYI